MGKLTQATLISILRTMIQDQEFVISLANCIKKIFRITPLNLRTEDPFEIVVNEIMKYFETHTETQNVEIPGIRSTLIGMLKEKQFLAFARLLRMLEDSLEYPDLRIISYLKQLKFRSGMDGESISPWIDVHSTAEAVIRELNPFKLRIFARLSREEKCLLQGFTSEQIAVMSKFSPGGIVTLSKVGRLPPSQRSIILGLDRDKIQSMTGEAGTLAEGIHDLTVEERGNYLNLSPKEVDILNNLNDDYKAVVSRFTHLDEVMNVAKNLHPSQRNLMLSLREEEIHALLGIGYGDQFYRIQLIVHQSPMIIQRSCALSIEEHDAILELRQEQRLVLAKAYALGHDGLFMIHELGPELTSQVLSGKEELSVMQMALKKKLENVKFDKNILSQLSEIMEHKSQALFLNLSERGIKLLWRTADLNEAMIGIVEKLSDSGMEVLIDNDKLTGEEISILGNLGVNEGNVLMNLDVKQRYYLSDKPDMTKLPRGLFNPMQQTKLRALSDGAQSVLERIMVLSDDEHRLLIGLKELDTTVLTTLSPIGLNLFASLTFEKLHLLSSFLFWRFGESMIFEFLKIPPNTSYEDKIGRTRRILGTIPSAVKRTYVPMIAGVIEVLRLNGVVPDSYVNEIIPMIEGPTHMTTLSLMFKVNLLKFSVRDSKSLVPEFSSQIEGNVQDIVRISQFDQIRTIEDVMFIRWILSSSSNLNTRILFAIGQGSLIYHSFYLGDGHKLEALLSASTSQLDGVEHKTLIQNFKQMLKTDRYVLATCFFFSIGRKQSEQGSLHVTRMFVKYFDADECFEFLNTQANDGFLHRLRDEGLHNILSDPRFPNPTILEVCLYYNRGNLLALAEKLDEGQLWKLLENRPLTLLRIMTRNIQFDLIKLFGKVAEVNEVLTGNRMEILQYVMEELKQHPSDFSPSMYLYIARGIRRLTYWPSFLGTDIYVAIISEYTKIVQWWLSRGELREMLDSFVSKDITRENLISAVEKQLGTESVVFLRHRERTSCVVGRKRRGAGELCADSKNTKDLPSKAKQRLERGVFDETQSTLYDELLEYSKRKFSGKELDPKIQQDLISRLKNIPLDSLDPRIRDIVATLDDPQKFDSVLKQSGVLNKIERVASGTGLAITLFLVGKHIINRDIENLGFDALNLWIMPKIGGHLTEVLAEPYPVIGPVIGSTVTNFVAFLGLVDGIIMRNVALNAIDEKLADLSIVTNAVFIAANIPTVATLLMESFGVQATIVEELVGPAGVVLSVSAIVGSYLIGADIEMERVTGHLQLSFREKLSLYWDILWGNPVPEQLKIDIEVKEIYTNYITNHLRRLNGKYDKIALSLPSLLITGRDQNTSLQMDHSPRVKAIYPFSTTHKPSKLFPENLEGYDFVCGPSAEDADVGTVNSQTKEFFIPTKPNDDCQNIVSFREHVSSNSSRTFLYVTSDASIDLSDDNPLDMVFHGQGLTLRDNSSNGYMNTFNFQSELYTCMIHKKGRNFFLIVGKVFNCNLKNETEGQLNTVVIKSDFKDSRGIHSIIGSDKREKIEANFADFVDGKGGGDLIKATERTIVKGYLNDFIKGNCVVILPFKVNEIKEIIVDTRISISNQTGSWFAVDGNARMMTADYYTITPIRTLKDTHHVYRAHIKKIIQQGISIEDELPVLRNLKIPNCSLVKQVTSANHDIVLSDVGKIVFYMDKDNHEYYWEAPKQPGNLYIFRKTFGRVTISHANGILDFKELGMDPDSKLIHTNFDSLGGYKVSIGHLHVSLFANFENVTITFDGKKYFELQKTGMSRNWCSHTFPIAGRVFIDGNDFHGYYNCFEFQSDEIHFLRLHDHLILISGKQILTIRKYYPQVHGEIELSVKLQDGKIIEAPAFRKRADEADKLIYYEVESLRLQIYHNQPVDEHHVGYVDLEHQSMKDVEMIVDSGGLLLLYNNSILVQIQNWNNYEPARRMVFAFNDSFLPNAECIFSTCDPNDIVEELEIAKHKRSATNNASRGYSWINAIINPIRNYYATLFLPGTGSNSAPNKFSTDSCITSNVNLVLVLLQNFLDRVSPLPTVRTVSTVETLSNVINLVEEFKGNNDSFQLYSDVVELVRNQRYDAIQKLFITNSKKTNI